MDETYIGRDEPGPARPPGGAEQESARRRRRGADRATGLWPLSDGPARRRVGRLAACVPRRQRAGGRDRDHRRLGALCAGDQGPLHPRPDSRRCGAAGAQAAPRRAQGLLTGQTMVARHPPGVSRPRPPAQLPQRVRVPLQPPPIAEPRARLLPRARARCRPRPAALPRPDRQPSAQRHSAPAAENPRAPSQPGALPAGRPWRASDPHSG